MKLEILRTKETKSEIVESMIREGLADNRPFYIKTRNGSTVNIINGHWTFHISDDLLICQTKDGKRRVYDLSDIVEFHNSSD